MNRAIAIVCTILTALSLALPVRIAAGAQGGAESAPKLEAELETAPVLVDDQKIFRVRGTSSYPAGERAAAIAKRIEDVAADSSLKTVALRIDRTEDADVIMAGDRPIMYVTDSDARLEQMSRGYLAKMHLERVGKTIDAYRSSRSRERLIQASLYGAGATLLLTLLIVLLVPLGRRIERLLSDRVKKRIDTAGLQSVEMMRAENIWRALHGTLTGVRVGLIVLLLLVYLHVVLSLFPWTRGLAKRLLGLDTDALTRMGKAVLGWIPDLIILVILYFVFRLLLKLLHHFFDAIRNKRVTISGFDPEWARPTYKMARFALLAFAVVVAYPYLPGSESAAFKGISVFIGLVFSLGSSAAVSNIIAGYLIFYRRVFRVGDRVKVGEVVGDVLAIRLQVTHLLSLKNEEVTIPNSQILSGNVMNFSALSAKEGLILHTEVGIGYEVPWRQVEAMLLKAAQRSPTLLAEPPPFVLVRRLADFCIIYELNVYTKRPQDSPWEYDRLHRHILDVFNEYGVQIMTPAYVADPPQPKVVTREQWYAPPAYPQSGIPPSPVAVDADERGGDD